MIIHEKEFQFKEYLIAVYLWKNFVVKFLKLSMSTHEDNLQLTIEGLLHFLENNFVKPIMQVQYLNTKRWV